MKTNLVFLPGIGFKASVWKKTADLFVDYETHLIDFPMNTGKTLTEIATLLSTKIPDQSIIMAWSLGGLLALKLADQYPHKCQKLIMVASTPKFVADQAWVGIPTSLIQNFHQGAQKNLDHLLQKFSQLVTYPHIKQAHSFLKNHLIQTADEKASFYHYLELLINEDCRSIFQSLSLPISFILGEKDAILPSKVATQLSPATVLLKAGHTPFLTHPEQFFQLSHEFIEEDHVLHLN